MKRWKHYEIWALCAGKKQTKKTSNFQMSAFKQLFITRLQWYEWKACLLKGLQGYHAKGWTPSYLIIVTVDSTDPVSDSSGLLMWLQKRATTKYSHCEPKQQPRLRYRFVHICSIFKMLTKHNCKMRFHWVMLCVKNYFFPSLVLSHSNKCVNRCSKFLYLLFFCPKYHLMQT